MSTTTEKRIRHQESLSLSSPQNQQNHNSFSKERYSEGNTNKKKQEIELRQTNQEIKRTRKIEHDKEIYKGHYSDNSNSVSRSITARSTHENERRNTSKKGHETQVLHEPAHKDQTRPSSSGASNNFTTNTTTLSMKTGNISKSKTTEIISSINHSMNQIEDYSYQLIERLPKAVETLKISLRHLRIILRLVSDDLHALMSYKDFYETITIIDDSLLDIQDFLHSLLGIGILLKARFNKQFKKRLHALERNLTILGIIAAYRRPTAGSEAIRRLSALSGFPQFESIDIQDRKSWLKQAEMYYYGKQVTQCYKTAYRLYLEAANLGDAKAQFMIGKMSMEEIGVEGDLSQIQETGIKFLLKSCEQDYSEALNYMGELHMRGISNRVPKEPKLAFDFFSAAVDKGHLDAMCNLAQNLLEGCGCKKDTERAFALLSKCVEKKHPRAFTLLGKMYYCGTGVKTDYKKAVDLFKRASEFGHDGGLNSLGVAYEEGKGVVLDLKKAAHFYEKAKELGNINAYSNLGYIKLLQKEYLEGRNYLIFAAEHDHIEALYNLGQIYQQGLGVKPDLLCAYQYYMKAAKANYPKACTKIADMLFSGIDEVGLEPDLKSSYEYYLKGAKGNDPDAQNALGIIFEEGIFKNVNHEKAFQYYKSAIESSGRMHAQALFNLASLYLEGKGCSKDLNEAFKLLKEAATLGHENSKSILEQLNIDTKTDIEEVSKEIYKIWERAPIENRPSRRPSPREPEVAETALSMPSPIQRK